MRNILFYKQETPCSQYYKLEFFSGHSNKLKIHIKSRKVTKRIRLKKLQENEFCADKSYSLR